MLLAAPPAPARPVRLLRYQFDSMGQVSRHFHATGGRVVLFYPTLRALAPGEPILLDVTVATSEQHCTMRGTVIGAGAVPQYPGCWLEFPGHPVTSSLRNAGETARRRQRRWPMDLLVNVEGAGRLRCVGRLIDLAVGGGRISCSSARAGAGDVIRFSLFSHAAASGAFSARVAWSRGPELGFELKNSPPAERATVRTLVERARQDLLAAPLAVHPGLCRCGEGMAVAEPPLPRSAHRQTA